MSNHNPNEKLEPRKSKVSVALAINHGLGGPKAIPKGAADGQTVNIPSWPYDHSQVRRKEGGVPYWFGIRGMRLRPCAAGMSGFYRANFVEEPSEKSLMKTSVWSPYRKPTQVDRARSPRGTSDSSLRNSAKKRPYLRYKACPAHLTKTTSRIEYCFEHRMFVSAETTSCLSRSESCSKQYSMRQQCY